MSAIEVKVRHWLIDEENEGERLDVLLAEELEGISRARAQELIKERQALLNGGPAKASARLKAGDQVTVELPAPRELKLRPENLPLRIIYQDEDIAVIDKPKDMVTHPAHGHWEHTLVNALLYHLDGLSGINGVLRPGIVHRLDKDTSGVMVVAKNDAAHRGLTEQIKNRAMDKYYVAAVQGNISENRGRIEAPIGRSPADRKKMAVTAGGREAITEYEVMRRTGEETVVKIRLLTGRTHQIRVHFAYIKHPVLGDELYSSGKNRRGFTSQALHAASLSFTHPSTGERMTFSSPLPPELQSMLEDKPGGF